ncbi:hypothetical protein ED733_000367 [Metarhizium rileyi]|uniref:Uncharacterized protein n=1 Tax=Metarhizium rileyi (strain RCEF 4871) TaxID=1649241 RepID=A0A5C6G8E4_METRR|nr:hypothetical protein ED733_000367 [Metarhizium rileyi]
MNILSNDLNNTPVHFLAAWLQQQQKASTPPSWKGGWERWAQGQVALYMDNTDGFTDGFINNMHTFCELKCYSAANDDTPNDFLNEMEKDFRKVQTPLVDQVKGSTMWVVGLSQMQFREAIQLEGQKQQHAFWRNFEFVSVRAPGAYPGTSNFDIWYWKYVNNN